MKKTVKIILVIVAIGLAGAWAYWQYNKKRIVRNAIENAVSDKTDSLYYVHYDSSSIDEVSGSARFYNVTLQSDSMQQQLKEFDSASAENIYNIHIGEVAINGANIAALLSNEKVEANSIKITRPIIYIIESGTRDPKQHHYDTLSIYKKLLGKFKRIHAGEIIIEDGQLYITHKIDDPYVSLEGINATVKNVTIDSTKDYDNLVSYFIKDMNAIVKKTTIKDTVNKSISVFTDLEYNTSQKIIRLRNFQQKNIDSGKIVFDINNTYITGVNTDSFILKKQLKAEEFVSDGGLVTFYRKKKKEANNDAVEIDNNFFDEALLNKINCKNIKIVVYNRDNPTEPPFILTNVVFSASEIQNLYSGTNIKNLIGRSNWKLAADGFSFITKDKVYKMSVGAFNIDKMTGKAHIDHFSVKPLMSEAAYIKTLKEQHDLYDITINNIDIDGIDAKKLVTDKMLIAENALIQPIIKVSLDRTVPAFTGNKVGNYPHQLIQKIKFPVYIKKITAKNGYISYTEKSSQSKQAGTIVFSRANGTIENFTNIKDYISKNNILLVNASAKLMGKADLKTTWKLPLNTTDGSFIISARSGSFNAQILNPVLEPLALASIKKGDIKAIDFNMQGNDKEAKGITEMLYNDLKIEALKGDSTDRKKRDLISFFANLVVKDDNPKNGETRKGEMDIERDTTRSFFNLVWKGIFKAIKRIAIGKNDEK